ncbi:MAG: hypothetical protein P1V51_01110 [Deltaproteobacteria bacterium]|nr:hypothetical protein [Deltaproteobacteria bacterium]
MLLLSACVLCACGGPRPAADASPPPEGIDLKGVAAWHHQGTELRASVVAAGAHFPEGLALAELRGAKMHLVSPGLTFQAARARIDLETLEGAGEDEVILEGQGFRATGGRFTLSARSKELVISSPVRVETPGR